MTFVSFFEKGDNQWMKKAACRPESVEDAKIRLDLFFPPERGYTAVAAREFCNRCEVSEDCFSYAQDNGQRNGMWGGVMMSERPSRRSKHARG